MKRNYKRGIKTYKLTFTLDVKDTDVLLSKFKDDKGPLAEYVKSRIKEASK